MKLHSINALSEMTGVDRRTIKKRLAGIPVASRQGTAELYDSESALKLIFAPEKSSIEEERLGLVRAQRLKIESETAEREGRLTRTDNAARVLEEIVVSLRQTIVHAPELSDVVRSKLIQSLELDIHNAILRTEAGDGATEAGAVDSPA